MLILAYEAHNYLIPSFEKLLAEGRAFGAQSVLAYQFGKQVESEKLREAIRNLVQNVFLFQTQSLDEADYYMKLFARVYSNMYQVSDEAQDALNLGADDIMRLPAFQTIVRLKVRGEA